MGTKNKIDNSEFEDFKNFLKDHDAYENFKNNLNNLKGMTIFECCENYGLNENAIDSAFTWNTTPEGYEFWNDIYSDACYYFNKT